MSRVKYKAETNYYTYDSEVIPVFGIGINEALGAQHTLVPFIGFGWSRNLNSNISSWSVSIGLNINFKDSIIKTKS